MFNVVMAAPTPFFSDRGCHVRILEEIQAVQKLGTTVSLCTYHNGQDVPGIDINRIPNIPWYKKVTAGPSLHKPYLDFFLFIKFTNLCFRKRPDLIHTYLHEGALIGALYRELKNIPLVVDLQGGLSDELKAHQFLKGNQPMLTLCRLLEGYIDRKATALMVCSETMRHLLIEEFRVGPERIYVIPDGVNLNFFKPIKNKMELRKKYNLPLDKKIVVYLGLLTGYQGVDSLLESIKYIKRKNQEVHFLIMGYPQVNFYQTKAKELGIEDMVTFTGRLPYSKAPEYVGMGDIAVSPKLSKTEANGKLLNYMAVGLPVVVFDTPVNREILGSFGIYAEFAQAESFARRLEGLLENPGEARDLGERLRKRAEEKFSWDVIGKKIMGVYEKVI